MIFYRNYKASSFIIQAKSLCKIRSKSKSERNKNGIGTDCLIDGLLSTALLIVKTTLYNVIENFQRSFILCSQNCDCILSEKCAVTVMPLSTFTFVQTAGATLRDLNNDNTFCYLIVLFDKGDCSQVNWKVLMHKVRLGVSVRS